MRIFYRAFQFRVVLHTDEERMVGQFHDLYETGTGIFPTGDHSGVFKIVDVFIIEFPAMAVALADMCGSVYRMCQRALADITGGRPRGA